MKSVFITGGADGIGAGLARRLYSLGYRAITLADINLEGASTLANELGPTVFAVHCDVSSEASQRAAVQSHLTRHGSLDIAILNAGIMESGSLFDQGSDDWRRSLDINLMGVLYGVRIAVQNMTNTTNSSTSPCTILVVSSAGGIFPMPMGPVYSVAKAGVVMLTHSLGPVLMKNTGIRLCALCPEYVDTNLVRGVREQRGDAAADALLRPVQGKLLKVEQVVDVGVALLQDSSAVGKCALVLSNGQVYTPDKPRLRKFDLAPGRIHYIVDCYKMKIAR